MSGYHTAEETRQHYIGLMGQNLGTCYYELWQLVASLHMEWDEYVELFGKHKDRVDLLNNAAPLFFKIAQDALFRDIVLQIARLSDPPKSSGKPNLSLPTVVSLVRPEKKDEVQQAVLTAKVAASPCRDWRNRHIAHRDFDLATKANVQPLDALNVQRIDRALSAIADVMNILSGMYCNSTTYFRPPSGSGGALSLLYVLDDGIGVSQSRREQRKPGEMFEAPKRRFTM